MAFSSSSILKHPRLSTHTVVDSSHHSIKSCQLGRLFATRCELEEPSENKNSNIKKFDDQSKGSKLGIGSPVVFVAAPKAIKTASAMPCLRVNTGLVKPGDVGRIVSRKPKDVWAVRLNIGTYLIDGKYFKALELDNDE